MLKRGSMISELRDLKKFSKKFRWNFDLDNTLNTYSYQALVLTDNNQKIIWVNDGFVEMTGYNKSFAMNQSSSFLQGKETSPGSIIRIRKKIMLNAPFKDEIINYRKNGSIYRCELQIFPVFGDRSLHFLALEREIA
ncbi:MAG: PAS domain-containing protein [Bacteroidales bacterium]|nr:PAS domain-containing protein [Bacteroidales bacterium]